jgi:protein tyrosine phosphatase
VNDIINIISAIAESLNVPYLKYCKNSVLIRIHSKGPHNIKSVELHYRHHQYNKSLNVRALSILCIYYSAGIGRTGTYIALDAFLEEGRTTGNVNIAKFLMKMRYNRMNMIQTPVSKNIFLSNVSYEYINVTLTASNYAGIVVIV